MLNMEFCRPVPGVAALKLFLSVCLLLAGTHVSESFATTRVVKTGDTVYVNRPAGTQGVLQGLFKVEDITLYRHRSIFDGRTLAQYEIKNGDHREIVATKHVDALVQKWRGVSVGESVFLLDAKSNDWSKGVARVKYISESGRIFLESGASASYCDVKRPGLGKNLLDDQLFCFAKRKLGFEMNSGAAKPAKIGVPEKDFKIGEIVYVNLDREKKELPGFYRVLGKKVNHRYVLLAGDYLYYQIDNLARSWVYGGELKKSVDSHGGFAVGGIVVSKNVKTKDSEGAQRIRLIAENGVLLLENDRLSHTSGVRKAE